MRSGDDWAAIPLGEGLRLILGWRDAESGGLVGLPIDLSDGIAQVLHETCTATLSDMQYRQGKPYSNLGNVDGDEFLALDIVEPTDDSGDDAADPPLEELLGAADIVSIAMGAFAETEFLGRDDLEGGGWLFYSVVVEVEGEDEPLAFVRQYNPQRGFGPGKLLGFFSDKLERAVDPVFQFDLHFDVIVAADEVAVLSPTAFQRVFADVGVVDSEVPGHAATLVASLQVNVSAGSVDVLVSACKQRHRLAARLRRLARAPHLQLVTAQSLEAALLKHGLDPDRFGSGGEIQMADLSDVRQLLDVLEKRYFEEDFTGAHMRADNASPLA